MHRLVRFLLLLLGVLAAGSARATPRSFRVDVLGSGPPIILIPGLACSGEVWASTVQRYRGSHRLYVITLAGFDDQPPIEGSFLPTVRAELAAYVRAQQLEKPVVIGHSLGGVLAMALALDAPEAVGALVIVDALPFLPAALDPVATVESTRAAVAALRKRMTDSSPEDFAAQSRAALASMISDPKNVDLVASENRHTDRGSVAKAMFELMTTDLRPRLGELHLPTLVLAASLPYGVAQVKRSFVARYAALAGHRLVMAERARHFIMLDDPALFFRELDAMLTPARKP